MAVPEINDEEVLIKMECVGVCGTDVKMYTIKSKDIRPVVLGHEGSGVIVQKGSKVNTLAIGDAVAIEPAQPCRSCKYCLEGRYNLCVSIRYCSIGGTPGNCSTFYKHEARFCHKLPKNVTLEEGAAVQPLSVAVHACRRAGVKLGSKVAILGAGPIGVLCAMTARAMGASKILITEKINGRLEKAKKVVDYAILIKPNYTDEEIVTKITNLMGFQPDICMDACGDVAAQRVALQVTRNGGVVMIVGIGDDIATLPLTQALMREVDVRGTISINNTYGIALDMVSDGVVDLKSLITHHFPLSGIKQALDLAKEKASMKTIIHVQQ